MPKANEEDPEFLKPTLVHLLILCAAARACKIFTMTELGGGGGACKKGGKMSISDAC